MSERFLRKQLFQIGFFYQLNVFNAIYLDKTGELISKSEGLLKNWNGNSSAFQFSSEDDKFNGKYAMDQFWYNDQRQGDYSDDKLKEFSTFISKANEIAIDVYKPKYYTRIGFRLQFIAKKTSDASKKKYIEYYRGKFSELSRYGEFSTTAIGFDISSSPIQMKINVNYAIKETEIDVNTPKEGLLFDIDFFRKVGKEDTSRIKDINAELIKFVSENYVNVICSIAKEMGMIDEA
jgi:hypothetical protein